MLVYQFTTFSFIFSRKSEKLSHKNLKMFVWIFSAVQIYIIFQRESLLAQRWLGIIYKVSWISCGMCNMLIVGVLLVVGVWLGLASSLVLVLRLGWFFSKMGPVWSLISGSCASLLSKARFVTKPVINLS